MLTIIIRVRIRLRVRVRVLLVGHSLALPSAELTR